MNQREEEGLLSRWSRRKLQTQEEDETLATEQPEVANVVSIDEQLKQPIPTDDDMPPLESLTEDSDFSMFMSSGVSDKLRNLALRKMFQAPEFNIRDGLDEYDDDFTTFEKLGDIVTSDMKHQIEMLERKRQQEAELEAAKESVVTEQEQTIDDSPEQFEQSDIKVENNESV